LIARFSRDDLRIRRDCLVQLSLVSQNIRKASVQLSGIRALADRFAALGLGLLQDRLGFGSFALRPEQIHESLPLPSDVVAVILLARLGH
jgi:hypothetical protein